jgi:hypothetical protein
MTIGVLSTTKVSFTRGCLERSLLWYNSGMPSLEPTMEEYKVLELSRVVPGGSDREEPLDKDPVLQIDEASSATVTLLVLRGPVSGSRTSGFSLPGTVKPGTVEMDL